MGIQSLGQEGSEKEKEGSVEDTEWSDGKRNEARA